MHSVKIYLVGGAVRDLLLGLEPKDKDYVVVGATPEAMIENGFTQVGASFPVFLHPETGEEYALARTERKTGTGYHGFETFYDPSVTLEDDLMRRDLTINSMAMDQATGEIIDPFGGQKDLHDGVLRHTSEAFADDPLRVLRLARFVSRYGFKVAKETIDLSIKLVDSGELDALPRERIWTELSKGFSENNIIDMLYTLRAVGALQRTPLVDYFGADFNVGLARSYMTVANDVDSHLGEDEGFPMFYEPVDRADVDLLLCMPPLAELSNDALIKMKVPNGLRDAARLEKKLSAVLMKHELTVDDVHSLFQATRFVADEKSPTMALALTVSQIKAATALRHSPWTRNLFRLHYAARAVRAIDMAAVVASGDMSTVKFRVENAKYEAVKKLLG